MAYNASYGTVAVGTSAVQAVKAKASRRRLLIQNKHASQDVYVGDDDQVTSSNGIWIAPGGSMSFEEFNGPVWLIASGAATDVRYFEVA